MLATLITMSGFGDHHPGLRDHDDRNAHSWWSKSGDEYRAALQERNRSKVGRMARLRGQVETAEALGPEMLPLPLQEKINQTVDAMRKAGAPEADIEDFLKGQAA